MFPMFSRPFSRRLLSDVMTSAGRFGCHRTPQALSSCRTQGMHGRAVIEEKPSRVSFKPLLRRLRSRRTRRRKMVASAESTHAGFSGQHLERIENSFKGIREAMIQIDDTYKYRGIHAVRWLVLFSVIGFVSVYGFRKEIKENIGSTGAEITSRTLSDEEVLRQAKELASYVVYEILSDKQSLVYATRFVNKILAEPSTQEAFTKLLIRVSQDQNFQAHTATFFATVMQTDTFKARCSELGSYTAHSTLDNKAVYDHALNTASQMMCEPMMQQKGAEAFWGSLHLALVPGFLKNNKATNGTTTNSTAKKNKGSSSIQPS